MIKSLKIFISLVVMMLCVAGCRKGDINGDLDGQWQIMELERVGEGEVCHPERTYYCLYLHTVNLTKAGGGVIGGNMMYEEGKLLTLNFPNTKVEGLYYWGIYDRTTTFEIEHLSSEKMVLKSDKAIIVFRKF